MSERPHHRKPATFKLGDPGVIESSTCDTFHSTPCSTIDRCTSAPHVKTTMSAPSRLTAASPNGIM